MRIKLVVDSKHFGGFEKEYDSSTMDIDNIVLDAKRQCVQDRQHSTTAYLTGVGYFYQIL